MSWFLRGIDMVVRCCHEFCAIRCLNLVIAWQFYQNIICVFDLVIVWIQCLLGSLFCATLLGKISFWSFWILFFIKSLFCATILQERYRYGVFILVLYKISVVGATISEISLEIESFECFVMLQNRSEFFDFCSL